MGHGGIEIELNLNWLVGAGLPVPGGADSVDFFEDMMCGWVLTG